MKIIIDIPDNIYDAIKEAQTIISGQRSGKTLLQILVNSVENGIPLDDVKAEIEQIYQEIDTCSHNEYENAVEQGKEIAYENVLDILDNIGKTESEDI